MARLFTNFLCLPHGHDQSVFFLSLELASWILSAISYLSVLRSFCQLCKILPGFLQSASVAVFWLHRVASLVAFFSSRPSLCFYASHIIRVASISGNPLLITLLPGRYHTRAVSFQCILIGSCFSAIFAKLQNRVLLRHSPGQGFFTGLFLPCASPFLALDAIMVSGHVHLAFSPPSPSFFGVSLPVAGYGLDVFFLALVHRRRKFLSCLQMLLYSRKPRRASGGITFVSSLTSRAGEW